MNTWEKLTQYTPQAVAAGLLMLAGSMVAGSAAARAEIALPQLSPKLTLSGSLRMRGEFWNWFEPTGTQTNEYAFFATVVRGAVRWSDDPFDALLEVQNSTLLGLPADAAAAAPQGPLGLGAVYFAHNRRREDTSVFLKQGFVTLKRLGIEGLTVTGGRFEFLEGSEVMTKEPTLDWLKRLRLSQRLIGPFGWSHVGRAFDGVTASFTRAPLNFTLLAARPTQGGFDLAGMKELDTIDLLYTAINLTRPAFARTSDARLFYIYYSDGRGLPKADNRSSAISLNDRRHTTIHTEGAHWITVLPSKVGPIDLLAWGAIQLGNWGRQDHQAWAWNLEAGWQPRTLPWRPWLRVGYSRTSGDDDPNDSDHNTFFQLLPTARIYSWSTFYNLMNNEDGFVQCVLRPGAGLVWRTDFHNIRLSEGRDLWYQGSGATLAERTVGVGFPGRRAFGHRDLFQVLETSLSYDWSPAINVSLYYGHVFGGRVVRAIFAGDQADFGYIEVTLTL
jgi:hypothetical protein